MLLDDALQTARDAYIGSHPTSAALAERARTVLPGGNTRSVLHIDPFSFRVADVEGAYLTDVDGNVYLDLLGDYSAGLLGHRSGVVSEAVRTTLDRGWSLGAMSEPEITFAEAVVDRFPSIEQVRFTNSGTEAAMMAVLTARHTTGRDRVVVFDGGYHGGLLYFGPSGAPLRAPFDYGVLAYNDIAAVEDEFATYGDRIACVLVEPMLGASGCIPADPAFLATLRDRTRQAGSVLIFDEVMTSRLAWGGAQQLTGVIPDMTVLGKYLAGGLSFGAFGGRRPVMSAFDPDGGGLTHGGTFNNNAFTMAAGVAVHASALSAQALDALTERGERFRAALAGVFAASPLPFSVTGWGSLCAIHPVDGPVRSPADARAGDTRWRDLLFYELLAGGFYFAQRGYLALSMDVGQDDLDRFVGAVAAFCERHGAMR
jgi:glutamate-1-semialdehyde 2,1-aminomutase